MSARVNVVSTKSGARAAILLLVAVVSACSAAPQLRAANGQLAPCAAKRCVSSVTDQPAYAIAPIRYSGTREAAQAAMLRILGAMPGAALQSHSEDYVHATFTTPRMRYIDDLELVLPAAERVIHVRSSSRIGYYDFDTNRERVEDLRARFEALQP